MDKAKDKTDKQNQLEKRPSFFKQNIGKAMTGILIVCAGISFYFILFRYNQLTALLKEIISILQPITIGLVIAYLLNPIMSFWEEKILLLLCRRFKNINKIKKVSRGVSILFTLALAFMLIVMLGFLVIPELVSSIYNMALTLPKQLEEFEAWFTSLLDMNSNFSYLLENLIASTTDYFETWLKSDLLKQLNIFLSGFTVGIINVINALMNLLIGVIVSIYVLSSKDIFIGQGKKIIYALFKPSRANVIINTARKSHQIFGGFISGKLIDSLIIGMLCFLGLSILDTPYVVLVSVIVGITNIIPFFGPYIGAIPSAVLILLTNPIKGLYFIIFIIILQQIDGNIIGPKILGDSTGLSAFWVVFSILLGGGLFGFLGMIMGVPVFAVIYYIIKQFIESILASKKLPKDTVEYCHVNSIDIHTQTLVYEAADAEIKENINADKNDKNK